MKNNNICENINLLSGKKPIKKKIEIVNKIVERVERVERVEWNSLRNFNISDNDIVNSNDSRPIDIKDIDNIDTNLYSLSKNTYSKVLNLKKDYNLSSEQLKEYDDLLDKIN